jgi:hypothetical protein
MENKETLKEVAERVFPDGCDGTNRSAEIYRRIFITGAEWQAERMYSEGEVISLLRKYRFDLTSQKTAIIGDTAPLWFEQFKKTKDGE